MGRSIDTLGATRTYVVFVCSMMGTRLSIALLGERRTFTGRVLSKSADHILRGDLPIRFSKPSDRSPDES